MFLSVEDYKSALKNLSQDLKSIYDRTTVLKIPITDYLTDYKIRKVDEDFLSKDVNDADFVNDSRVGVSLASALAGNTLNLGKTYSDVYKEELDDDRNYSSIELETSTDAKIELVIFKGVDLNISFDDDGLLKVYAIILRTDENPQFVDKGKHYGRTINLYSDITTFIYAPSDGVIHGIANYAKPLELVNDELKDELKKNGEYVEPVSDSLHPKDAVFVIYDGSERLIPSQEGNIIDWEFYNGIKKLGYNYFDTIMKDFHYNNIKFTEGSELEDIREAYKVPLVNYRYQNRENCALTSFYANKMNVDVLRLDITGTRSTTAFKGLDSFTSVHDYCSVNKVFTVFPSEPSFGYEGYEWGLDVMANDFLVGMGYQKSKRYVFIQAKNEEEFESRKKFIESSFNLIKLDDMYYEYICDYEDWNFRAFLVGPDFKFVDEVSKLD